MGAGQSAEGEAPPKPPPPPPPENPVDFTLESLRPFDGSDDKPIYVCALGTVFDTSSRDDFYGQDGGYHMMAGRDASVALAKMSLDKKDVEEPVDYTTLDASEMEVLTDWVEKYKGKYPIVGRLIKEGVYTYEGGHWVPVGCETAAAASGEPGAAETGDAGAATAESSVGVDPEEALAAAQKSTEEKQQGKDGADTAAASVLDAAATAAAAEDQQSSSSSSSSSSNSAEKKPWVSPLLAMLPPAGGGGGGGSKKAKTDTTPKPYVPAGAKSYVDKFAEINKQAAERDSNSSSSSSSSN